MIAQLTLVKMVEIALTVSTTTTVPALVATQERTAAFVRIVYLPFFFRFFFLLHVAFKISHEQNNQVIHCLRYVQCRHYLKGLRYLQSLRWLDWISSGQYLSSLSINDIAINNDIEKRSPPLHYIRMKIC